LLAESGLCKAAKDISQGGIVGTAIMLAECSCVGIEIDVDAVPAPPGVAPERWLSSFPSFGFLLSVAEQNCDAVLAAFAARNIAAADIGRMRTGSEVLLTRAGEQALVWDFARQKLLGCVP
jgi:selenophosphate synthetase-related protein